MIALIDLMVEEIDLLRSKMHGISTEVQGLTHPRLIRVSKLLDRKLNSYYRLISVRTHYGNRTS